jgi:pimeloyl-ACP methyl ester carboxylesterase
MTALLTQERYLAVPQRGTFLVRTNGPHPEAPPVILLHGLAGAADLNWSATIPVLAHTYCVVAPDLRGHGLTMAQPDRFTLEDAADDVAAIADSLALDSFIVVGYSMGGAIAQLLAKRHRNRVRGLVLCATSQSFRGSLREQLMFAAIPGARAASNALPKEVACTVAQHIAHRFIGDDAEFDPQTRRFDVGKVLEAAAALGDFCSHDWIGRIDAPTAVLVHLRDQLVPVDRQFALAHAISQSVVCPVVGDHFAPVQRPEAFVPTVTAAVHNVRRRSRDVSPWHPTMARAV